MGVHPKWLVFVEKSHLEKDDNWGYPQKRWMVFGNGKIPSFDSWMMTGATPMTQETSI